MALVDLLMSEHRLIERMVYVLRLRSESLTQQSVPSIDFVPVAVDFFRTYADRCHHGKEEGILFRDLVTKQLSDGHAKMINQLIAEHLYARRTVKALHQAGEEYLGGKSEVLGTVAARLRNLTVFYPIHIQKEDKRFFYPCIEYFSEEERERMLQEFSDFDKMIIHEKYRQIVDSFDA